MDFSNGFDLKWPSKDGKATHALQRVFENIKLLKSSDEQEMSSIINIMWVLNYDVKMIYN